MLPSQTKPKTILSTFLTNSSGNDSTVSTFLQAHISPTHLSCELRSFVNQK